MVAPAEAAAPTPAVNVDLLIVTPVDELMNAAMLELPFPVASVPVASMLTNCMSSTVTPVTPVITSADFPAAAVTDRLQSSVRICPASKPAVHGHGTRNGHGLGVAPRTNVHAADRALSKGDALGNSLHRRFLRAIVRVSPGRVDKDPVRIRHAGWRIFRIRRAVANRRSRLRRAVTHRPVRQLGTIRHRSVDAGVVRTN